MERARKYLARRKHGCARISAIDTRSVSIFQNSKSQGYVYMKRQFFVLQWLGIFRSATPAILLRFASQLDLNRLQIKGLIVFRQNLYFLSRRGARFLRKLHFHNPSSIQHNDLLQRGIKSLGKKSFQLDIERKIWCGSRYILADALMICNRNRVLICQHRLQNS